MNFERDICYLVSISLARDLRGKGIGNSMYLAIEGIAKDMSCERIRQTPSGWTNRIKRGMRETRRDYLKRKLGYVNCGLAVEKILR